MRRSRISVKPNLRPNASSVGKTEKKKKEDTSLPSPNRNEPPSTPQPPPNAQENAKNDIKPTPVKSRRSFVKVKPNIAGIKRSNKSTSDPEIKKQALSNQLDENKSGIEADEESNPVASSLCTDLIKSIPVLDPNNVLGDDTCLSIEKVQPQVIEDVKTEEAHSAGNKPRSRYAKPRPNLQPDKTRIRRASGMLSSDDEANKPVITHIEVTPVNPKRSDCDTSDPPVPNVNNKVCMALKPSSQVNQEKEIVKPAKKIRKLQMLDEPVDRRKLTMKDMIFMNPTRNPTKAVIAEQERKQKEKEARLAARQTRQGEPGEDKEMAAEEEKRKREEEKEERARKAEEAKKAKAEREKREEAEDSVPVPQVKIGPDGSIILNEQSLVIDHPVESPDEDMETVLETNMNAESVGYKRSRNYAFWTPQETKKFYLALCNVGSDFSLMEQLFKGRTRVELKRKFKREEKINRRLIDRVLHESFTFDEEIYADIAALDTSKKPKPKKVRILKPRKTAEERRKYIRKTRKGQLYYDGSDSGEEDDEEQHSEAQLSVREADADDENEERTLRIIKRGTKRRMKPEDEPGAKSLLPNQVLTSPGYLEATITPNTSSKTKQGFVPLAQLASPISTAVPQTSPILKTPSSMKTINVAAGQSSPGNLKSPPIASLVSPGSNKQGNFVFVQSGQEKGPGPVHIFWVNKDSKDKTPTQMLPAILSPPGKAIQLKSPQGQGASIITLQPGQEIVGLPPQHKTGTVFLSPTCKIVAGNKPVKGSPVKDTVVQQLRSELKMVPVRPKPIRLVPTGRTITPPSSIAATSNVTVHPQAFSPNDSQTDSKETADLEAPLIPSNLVQSLIASSSLSPLDSSQ